MFMAIGLVNGTGVRVDPLEVNVKKEETRKFAATSLTITGKMSLRVPGREEYTDVTELNVMYPDFNATMTGFLTETDENAVDVISGRLEIKAFRTNPTERTLYRKQDRMELDPEITFYQRGKKVVLNQVIGKPVVHIDEGKVTYK